MKRVFSVLVIAAILPKEGRMIRAGYSANADIVLDSVKDVLAVNERLVQFDKGKAYVEVETAPQQFERREIEVGLSDGINIQVTSGVTEADRLKGREQRAK